MSEIPNLLFMIESGPMLELVRDYIAQRVRVLEANKVLIEPLRKEYGVERASTDRRNGVVLGVVFPKNIHPDFTKPKGRHNISYPKKNTPWAKLFAEQKGHPSQSTMIANKFGVPLSLGYKSADGGEGWRCVGNMLAECGFLFMGPDGPYAMWIPDVPGEVAAEEARSHTVKEPAKSFRPEFPGCRRIETEEWDILVAQHNLAEKRSRARIADAGLELPA